MNCVYLLDAETAKSRLSSQLCAAAGIDVLPARMAAQESYDSASSLKLRDGLSDKRVLQNPIRLLSISDEASLLSTRAMVLASVGYDVTSVSSAEAFQARPFSRFACVLICHSIPEAKAVLLANLMRRKKPPAPIIRLSFFRSVEPDSFTSICDMMHDPKHFVADVKAVLGDSVLRK